MKEGSKHLYGVIEVSEGLDFGSIGVGGPGDQIHAVTYKKLSAIVCNTPFTDYKAVAKDLVIRHLLDHQKIIEKVMNSCSIIPFKFGSLAQSEKEVEQILAQGYTLFQSLLPWVRDRVEFELVATWDRERVFKTLYEEEAEIQSLQRMIESKSGGEGLAEKIKLGKLVRHALLKRKVLFKEKILPPLKECAESQCEHSSMDDLMILNAAFLLKKEMESEFDRRVQYLDRNLSGEVCFRLIGPLPLYSFQCIEVEWSDADRVRNALRLLGLNEGATSSDLRNAYYRKAQFLHPDKTGSLSNSPSEFEKVIEAYAFLKRYYSFHPSFVGEERIPLMGVRRNSSN